MPETSHAQDWFEEIERWPSARLRSWQLDRLREVVAHARANVSFYRSLWSKAGLRESGLDSFDDFARLPIITKQDLLKARGGWANPCDGPVGFSTRGTSGEPLLLWLGATEEEIYIAPTMRGFRWAGFAPGMTALLMSPVWHRLAACETHAIARLGGDCAFFWGSLGPDNMDSFLRTLTSVRPRFVTTTAPFLLALVRRAAHDGLRLAEAFRGVESIVAVGLPLTPRMREFLRARLQVGDVFERSGTQEGAALDDCRLHATPHIHEDVCYLEVVDADGAPVAGGERGRLVVTKLAAAGSIFVRYDTGDIAAFATGECECGCTFRRLKIYGRPESSVMVGERMITAYDVRLCVEENPALLGRNVLLIRDRSGASDVLTLAIEGGECDGDDTADRLRSRLGVARARIVWLGGLRINWGFRQVIDGREIGISNG